ncbi:MAG: HlyD family type I secretion periplasmic adaptor subunit [Campylobacterales bacterium]|nr:HlyD family type I secretion periplasmic adaptor subunit [Campylobacterales bacterium]
MKKIDKPIEYTEKDYEFMNSLSSAILQSVPSKTSKVIKIWLITTFLAIFWSSLAEIDEITRGDGEAIAYGQNQIIQNLEGGIVEEILVNEGQRVKVGESILKISNAKSLSTSQTNQIKYEELEAKRAKLYAQANDIAFNVIKTDNEELNRQLEEAKKLFDSNKLEFEAKDNSILEQITQKKQSLTEAKARVSSLQKSLEFVTEEIAMTEPMVIQGVKSKVDFLKLKRESSAIENDIEAAKLSLPRLASLIEEANSNRKAAKQLFISTAKEQLNAVTAELARIQTQQVELSDQVDRTLVKSPVEGIIQRLFVNTVGGVIKPGADLIEIVPTSKKLYLEIKIKPSDIAFIHPEAEAKVKISAYPSNLHGVLTGRVVSISPDTVTDNKENTFYLIHVETDKNHLGTEVKPLKIIPGMTVSVDIITGKKTVLQYILKPILKTKEYVFTEK